MLISYHLKQIHISHSSAEHPEPADGASGCQAIFLLIVFIYVVALATWMQEGGKGPCLAWIEMPPQKNSYGRYNMD
jgi:hypothetical protein